MKKAVKGLVAGSALLTALATGFVAHWEGRSLTAYQDVVGVWTICYGETKGVKRGDTATPAECSQKLATELKAYEAGLDRCLLVAVPGPVKVAFLSWTYNVGVGAACSSTLVRKANAGDLRGACNELPRWNKAGGLVWPGLSRRRAAEQQMCLEALR